MRRITLAVCCAAALLAAGAWLLRLEGGMDAAEAVRKLSGLRLSAELYRQEKGRPPASFSEVLSSGKLEAAPELKLAWHFRASAVRDVPALRVADTGGWAYVNDPASPDFGLIFIDCAHKDEKGRFWSEF